MKRINDEFSIAGQLDKESLSGLKTCGFESVLNLRFAYEKGFLPDEPEAVRDAGMSYAQAPCSPPEPEPGQVDDAIKHMRQLPKPVLVHCASGKRAEKVVTEYLQQDKD